MVVIHFPHVELYSIPKNYYLIILLQNITESNLHQSKQPLQHQLQSNSHQNMHVNYVVLTQAEERGKEQGKIICIRCITVIVSKWRNC